jgi:hypothetical protein
MIGFLLTGAVGCATSAAPPPPVSGIIPGTEPMHYGGGDGSSCDQAVVIRESTQLSGVAAEYDWLKTRYPGYARGLQSLERCGERPVDRIHIRTVEGREMDVFFDISAFFDSR